MLHCIDMYFMPHFPKLIFLRFLVLLSNVVVKRSFIVTLIAWKYLKGKQKIQWTFKLRMSIYFKMEFQMPDFVVIFHLTIILYIICFILWELTTSRRCWGLFALVISIGHSMWKTVFQTYLKHEKMYLGISTEAWCFTSNFKIIVWLLPWKVKSVPKLYPQFMLECLLIHRGTGPLPMKIY